MTAITYACNRCAFWELVHEFKSSATPEQPHGMGLCRKLPPTAHATRDQDYDLGDALWPMTVNDDWCGQFSPVRESPWTPTTTN